MGVSISICISKSVSNEEWYNVYRETLKLVEKFPLAERDRVECNGIETMCLRHSKEREFSYGFNREKKRTGWCAEGDYIYLKTAEEYCLFQQVEDDEYYDFNPDAGDAMMGAIPAYMNYSWDEERFNQTYHLWGAKTQGELYHMYVLAIACVVEDRLKDKAFVYGDITRGQCCEAVNMANQYLDSPITTPSRCDMVRFFQRVKKLPFSNSEQFVIFKNLYLGEKDSAFGEFIRNNWTREILEDYWKTCFAKAKNSISRFAKELKAYLYWGFDLSSLCDLICFAEDEKGISYETFIRQLLETKIYVKEKDCRDIFEFDQNSPEPYSVGHIFAQFIYAGARNPCVNRYIPEDTIRSVLVQKLGDKCDVNALIDAKLEEDRRADPSDGELIQQRFKRREEIIKDAFETYDIVAYEHLRFYETGDTIYPMLHEQIMKFYQKYAEMNEEENFAKLMRATAKERCEWLVQQNRTILLRDEDWEKIFTNIKTNDECFERYYPMVRLKGTCQEILDTIRAVVTNDELYMFLKDS